MNNDQTKPAAVHSPATWRSRLRSGNFSDRLDALAAFGLTDDDVARAVPSAGPRSIRRWRTEGPPRTRAGQRWWPIDDLCSMIAYLLAHATEDAAEIVAWLRSRNPGLGYDRPLDALAAGRYEDLRAAADALLAGRDNAGDGPA